jgi:trimethylamine--corrinoid protein Co-methyltransferase
VISGPGMLDFENCQSFEKLVIDNELCGMALRMAKGVKVEDETIAFDLIKKVGPGGVYLAERHTLEWIRKEQFIPSEIIDRREWKSWKDSGGKDITKRAHEVVERKLKDVQENLDNFVKDLIKKC